MVARAPSQEAQRPVPAEGTAPTLSGSDGHSPQCWAPARAAFLCGDTAHRQAHFGQAARLLAADNVGREVGLGCQGLSDR